MYGPIKMDAWNIKRDHLSGCFLKSHPMLRDRFAWMIADRLQSDWLILEKHRELNILECGTCFHFTVYLLR